MTMLANGSREIEIERQFEQRVLELLFDIAEDEQFGKCQKNFRRKPEKDAEILGEFGKAFCWYAIQAE